MDKKILNHSKNLRFKNTNGITLIALVITIIVLLILASVSIVMLTGQNGILTQAQKAKTATEQSGAKERVALAVTSAIAQTRDGTLTIDNLKTEIENNGGNLENTEFPTLANIDNNKFFVKSDGSVLKYKKMAEISGQETENTATKDSFGNYIVVPAGFKVINTTDNVTDGIVVEDVSHEATAGSQFVWIPVGDVIKDNSGNTENITLSRYTFADDSAGTPTDQGSNEIIDDYDSNYRHIEINTSVYGNMTAKENMENEESGFRKSVKDNNGYYIGRYEARDKNATSSRTDSSSKTNAVVCTANNYIYNYVTQLDAATLSRSMYNDSNFESDLINSYAWDTAILFLQKFDNRSNKENLKAYSRQNSLNTEDIPSSQGTNNLEASNQDIICNVWDMASNCLEWTTETNISAYVPCTNRGGNCYVNYYYTSYRVNNGIGDVGGYFSFRPLLYL